MTVTVSVAALLFWSVNFLVCALIVGALLRDSDGEGIAIVSVSVVLLVVFMTTAAKIWGFL